MITDRPKFTTKWDGLVSILPLKSIQNYSPGLYSPYKKGAFGNVQFPILGKPARCCAAWLTGMEEKQTELETKNK